MVPHPTENEEPSKKKARLWLKISKTFPLDVQISDTIKSIKDQILLIEGTSLQQQKVFFDGNYLENCKTLADYKISTNSTIDVHIEGIMQISIKIPSLGKTLKFDVYYTDTAQHLKIMIRDKAGLSLNQQIIVFCGKVLNDNQVLIACGIRKFSTIYVMLNPLAELLLSVQMSSGDSFSFEAMTGYTIGDAKLIIESLKGVPASQQKLFLDNLELLDSFSLSSCKILNNSVIRLQVQMQIFVKILTGKTITIEVKDSDTISVTIAKIQSKTKLKRENFRITYSGKVLQDHENLAFYGIQKDSEIIMIPSINCDTSTWRQLSSDDDSAYVDNAYDDSSYVSPYYDSLYDNSP